VKDGDKLVEAKDAKNPKKLLPSPMPDNRHAKADKKTPKKRKK
jgi:hypothetical protein